MNDLTVYTDESHAGYDFPWMLHNIVPFGILEDNAMNLFSICDFNLTFTGGKSRSGMR